MKILCLGDSPYLKTGFGIVNDVAVKALVAAGHEVVVLGAQDTNTDRPYEGFTFVPTEDNPADMLGWSMVDDVIEQHKPDAVHIIGDPATATAWLIRDKVASLPVVAYVPVEGEPMNLRWTTAFRGADNLHLITCSNYGVAVLASEGFEARMAYHGVSDDFRYYELLPGYRDAMRESVGWTDKFVVMCVAQNVRRKEWPRLFEAIAMLKKRIPNIVLYAHTVPFNNFWLGGHDLPQLAQQMGIADRVLFPRDHLKHNDATPLIGVHEPGLVDLYNIADVFVLPSQVEGFGLPLAEAMKCGLPVVTTGYAAGAEVVDGAGILLPVNDWEINQSHSRYANVAPRDIASAIDRLHKSPEMRRQFTRKGLARAKHFTWDSYRTALIEEFDAIASSLPQTAQRVPDEEAVPVGA